MIEQPDALIRTNEHDAQNLSVIDAAYASGRINSDAAEYLKLVYSN